MIQGLYETHLSVSDLERSCTFYQDALGLTLARFEEKRRAAFFWIGKPQQAMLGLWEKPVSDISSQHFAFECDVDWILNESVPFLKDKGIRCWNFLKDGIERPMVFGWMPALSIYFHDPDGHELEFISILPGKPKPELGVLSYPEWLNFVAQS